jgi:dolichol-phosphate mannosyltransferase
LANDLAHLLAGIKIKDATSGYRAFSLSALKKIRYSSVKSEGYAFQIEMLFRCQKENLRLAEIPIIFVSRRTDKTKLSRIEILRFFATCFRLLFERLNS